jgi:hypothetical protein
MAKGVEQIKNGVDAFHAKLLDKAKGVSGFLARDVYTIYQNAQVERWQTENASEGSTWERINPLYAKSKLKRFAAYPGQGQRLMIATSRLVKAATGQDLADHRRLITDTSMEIHVTVPYGKYAEEVRPFMKFSPQTIKTMRDTMVKYFRESFK